MKRITALLSGLCLALGLTACNGQTETLGSEPNTNISQPDTGSEAPAVQVSGGQNVLIAYFTWADNTTVDNEETAIQSALSHYESVGDAVSYDDVDAISSASILQPGNTAQIAEWIQQRIGGDLFSIIVEEPYPSNYDECLDRASDEKAENARPELTAHIDNIIWMSMM